MMAETTSATQLHALDDLVSRGRTAIQRPGYRRRVLADIDVPGGVSTLRTLRVVATLAADGDPSIKEVAARLGVEHSTASRSVDTAVRAELLRKRACDTDQRRARVILTDEGQAILDAATEQRRDLVGDIVADWPPHDVDDLVRLLSMLCHGLDELEVRSR